MEENNRQPPSRRSRSVSAFFAGFLLGGISGALIGASMRGGSAAWLGSLAGGFLLGLGEALTDWYREPGQMKPLLYRILVSGLIGASFAAFLDLLFPSLNLILLALIVGAVSGLFGFQLNKLLLGILTGLAVGILVQFIYPAFEPTLLGALIVLAYRILSAVFLPGQTQMQLMAERVPAEEIRYVVPFEANSKYVGTDYFKDLARTREGSFKRNSPGIGIVESMDNMRGPEFNPGRVHPLIREFYEHTSRFKLNIRPVWKNSIKPLFWLFKRYFAQPIGQANLPFNMQESQRGVVSYIDSIGFTCDDIIDLRGWVRAFEASGEAIYVGVYTTFQHQGVGYVSVGFPLPDSNFTATLLPSNFKDGGLLLSTRNTNLPFPGHYLTASENGKLTVLKLPNFHEQIEVYVQQGDLRTEHRFYLAGINFLTLFYTMEKMVDPD